MGAINILDIVLIAVIAAFAVAGYQKGLIRTVYRAVSFFASIFIAWILFPHVARILRQTGLFASIQEGVARGLNLEGFFYDQLATRGAYVIDTLPVPAILQSLLHANNTQNMYDLLQVHTIEGYVAGFIANIALNGIAILIVFVVTMILLHVVGKLLDIVSHLPVLDTINSVGGLLIGLAVSLTIIWLGVIVAALFFTSAYENVYTLITGSWLARVLLEIALPHLVTV